MCEAALWVTWWHQGRAVAKTNCLLISLDAITFRKTIRKYLPQTRDYARHFEKLVTNSALGLADNCSVPILTQLTEIANQMFDVSKSDFDIKKCQPILNKLWGRNDWEPPRQMWDHVWDSAWKEAHLTNADANPSALINAMTRDLRNDAIIMFQTLYSQNGKQSPSYPALPQEETETHDQVVRLLKRLIICIAVCGLRSVPETGPQRSWPFPLASALCHGGRILVQLDGIPPRALSTCSYLDDLTFGIGGAKVRRHQSTLGERPLIPCSMIQRGRSCKSLDTRMLP